MIKLSKTVRLMRAQTDRGPLVRLSVTSESTFAGGGGRMDGRVGFGGGGCGRALSSSLPSPGFGLPGFFVQQIDCTYGGQSISQVQGQVSGAQGTFLSFKLRRCWLAVTRS